MAFFFRRYLCVGLRKGIHAGFPMVEYADEKQGGGYLPPADRPMGGLVAGERCVCPAVCGKRSNVSPGAFKGYAGFPGVVRDRAENQACSVIRLKKGCGFVALAFLKQALGFKGHPCVVIKRHLQKTRPARGSGLHIVLLRNGERGDIVGFHRFPFRCAQGGLGEQVIPPLIEQKLLPQARQGRAGVEHGNFQPVSGCVVQGRRVD